MRYYNRDKGNIACGMKLEIVALQAFSWSYNWRAKTGG